MKRSPLKRKTPLRARSPWRPVRRPLPRESAKRRRQRRVREMRKRIALALNVPQHWIEHHEATV